MIIALLKEKIGDSRNRLLRFLASICGSAANYYYLGEGAVEIYPCELFHEVVVVFVNQCPRIISRI